MEALMTVARNLDVTFFGDDIHGAAYEPWISGAGSQIPTVWDVWEAIAPP